MITLDLLKSHPDCIPTLAKIWFDVLGKIWLPEIPIKQVEQRFHEHLNDDIVVANVVKQRQE
ncbi:hypothetical protein Loa_02062 [Legionella oakridgensis ATCC 33761 = DSM 21215]|uniref:Acetyltransferase n=3 Tax=Legionella oakridgensis TaxID=29423 RepID=W0BFX6_9GAMM|nr:hypothetical protein Loa_02062 [Legionella oakridgensis ATCC 33761 = DSM 21215]ETO92845.1 hypothetical protein LOR_61c14990 [Legionella oakridgensis RV-2-2007]KTD37048.1 GNAT family acetyltransferase [Legionella oakridgensis]STY20643.1 acetyltransferase [Legionella longbeachae]